MTKEMLQQRIFQAVPVKCWRLNKNVASTNGSVEAMIRYVDNGDNKGLVADAIVCPQYVGKCNVTSKPCDYATWTTLKK